MLHRRVKVHGRQSSEASVIPPCPWGQPASMVFLSSVLFYIWKAVSKLAHAHWTMDWKLSPCQPLEAERSPASREIHYFQSVLQAATPSISKTASAKDRIDASIHVSWNLLKVKIESRCTHRERAWAGRGWTFEGTTASFSSSRKCRKRSAISNLIHKAVKLNRHQARYSRYCAFPLIA